MQSAQLSTDIVRFRGLRIRRPVVRTAIPTVASSSRPDPRVHASSTPVTDPQGSRYKQQVSELISSLEQDGQLATYDLRLGGSLDDTSSSSTSTNSTSSMDSSDISGELFPRRSSLTFERETSSSNEQWGQPAMNNVGLRESPFSRPPPALTKQAASITVCIGSKCKRKGSETLLRQFQAAAGEQGLYVKPCKCLKQCENGPAVRVVAADDSRAVTYTHVTGRNQMKEVLRDAMNEF